MKFLKNPEVDQGSKAIENLSQNEEEKLAKALENKDIPEKVTVQKKAKESTKEVKQKKMEKIMKTAAMLSLKGFYKHREMGDVLNRENNQKKKWLKKH